MEFPDLVQLFVEEIDLLENKVPEVGGDRPLRADASLLSIDGKSAGVDVARLGGGFIVIGHHKPPFQFASRPSR